MNYESHQHDTKPSVHARESNVIQYFLPGQIILAVDHPKDLDSEKLAGLLGTSPTFQELNKDKIAAPKPGSVFTFPMKTEQTQVTSLVPVAVDTKTPQEVFALLNKIYLQIKDKPVSVQNSGGLNISLQSVTPNWIVSGAFHGCGTGGPGSWPIPAHPPEGDDWKFKPQNRNSLLPELSSINGDGGGTYVAILDTAPTQHALDTAYAEWRWHHPLIERMLTPTGGPLHLHSATNADLYMTSHFSIFGHRYSMRDHGLFIAGIIHTIAPQAELHLYEMLNPYGVASLETIAQNFLKVFKDLENKRPLFINCSFMLDIPVAGVLDKDFPPEIRNQSEFMEHLIKTPRELFGWVTQQKDVYVVAAAGNDALHNNSNGGPGRPLTRYPAAFKNVLGVGALPKNASPVNGKYSAATYSNLADHKTPPEGYMTLGGEPGPDGVLGVYIGEFPAVKAKGCLAFLWQWLGLGKARRGQLPNNFHTLVPDDIEYKLNTTGWAWWAGTSFATPIITGTLAAAILQNPGTGSPLANVAEEILGKVSQQIAATVSVPNPLTVEGEKVILVTQSAQE